MERKIYLYGQLAKIYGKAPISVNANTTTLIIQGLCCKFGDKFKQFIRDHNFHIYKGKRKPGNDIGDDELKFTLGNIAELHLMPVIEGRSAGARIVVGVLLLVVGIVYAPAGPYLIPLGLSLIVGGVAEMLTPKPKISKIDQAGLNPSFMFNGVVNVTEQGGPVPLVLGRCRRASSVILSAGLSTERIDLF